MVRLGVKGNLENAASVNDPIVEMRVAGGSQNQSLDCDPATSTLRVELATGCVPMYTKNGGTACPGAANDLWARPAVALRRHPDRRRGQPGAGRPEPADPGHDKPTVCTAPNN